MSAAIAASNALMTITSRPPVVFVRGDGSWLFDHRGRRYLDFVQGWAVNCLGHCRRSGEGAGRSGRTLINAEPGLLQRADALDPGRALALTKASCFDRVFFANSGAEANEGAIKLARKWGAVHKRGAYRDHHLRGPSTAARWPPCRLQRQAGVRAAVRAEGAGLSEGATQRHRLGANA
jgi:acetylornithine/N-succinyldiaminopimelate aminotransferase